MYDGSGWKQWIDNVVEYINIYLFDPWTTVSISTRQPLYMRKSREF